ncbi:hypothetical protein N7532_002948 [Penicillium argentinense]|uniref:Phosphotransferase n=1 Tax=Penicillium argentinense TaxID=1131581 RepID=A0A9W9G1D9_9EURO|nr:uncharacterized protein N7532_002948 [Penicillium argentinense]KAJ5110303.1 hypothetical protein N7532_002948 [Penicillium argentinense]
MMQCTSSPAEAPAKLSSPPTSTTKQQFIDHVVSSFTVALDAETLYEQSYELTRSLRSKVDLPDSLAMLPSFVDHLPTGKEQGDVLAIDIGGSNMRAAIVSLEPSAVNPINRLRVRKHQTWAITVTVKSLSGSEFFSWIATNIQNFLYELMRADLGFELAALPAGLVWSFPLEQFELSDGNLREMGKGFVVGHELQGQSIKKCMDKAFAEMGLEIRLEAILNDSVSALLALSYVDPSTELSIIVGTGFNGGLRLPATAFNASKLRHRSNRQEDATRKNLEILVDAELSVVGQGILPRVRTTWDSRVAALSPFGPDVLGLELQVGGLFLGELVRQVVVNAINTVGLFDGHLPDLIQAPMTWELRHGAILERSELTAADVDLPQSVAESFGLPFKPSLEDTCLVRQICQAVTERAAAYVAVAAYSMRSLQVLCRDVEDDVIGIDVSKVSCLGSVIEKYPGFMNKSQEYLDQLQRVSPMSGPKFGGLQLQACSNSSLTGVAVAALLGKMPGSDTTSTTISSPPPPDALGRTNLPEPCVAVDKTTEDFVQSMSEGCGIDEDLPGKRLGIWAWFRRFVRCRGRA